MYHLDGPTQLLSHNQSQPFIVIQNHQNTLLISTYLHHLPFAASVPSLKLNCIFLLMQKLEFRGFQTDQHRFLHSTVPFLISLITHSQSHSFTLSLLLVLASLPSSYPCFRHSWNSLFSASKPDFEAPTFAESDFHFSPRIFFSGKSASSLLLHVSSWVIQENVVVSALHNLDNNL